MDSWIWLVFVGIGLIIMLVELVLGLEARLDLVFLGSAFIIGGLVTLPFASWLLTLIVVLIICLAYIVLGRKYVHRWVVARKEKTNIDAIIGKQGYTLQSLTPEVPGLVKVANEDWRAVSSENLEKGERIVVTGINGVTLSVEKFRGGN
ncbi:MAG TPA: NfeD family protein [Dehalococcoidales bacterium]|nr:NfeD family protein [Dehalococcoidales bacterium]